ncbi:MAG TPA: PsbP-related protein [Nitrososphaeraceae archaeon]|nr:PsbP-related protein [Nitrososphaeraceae archaeon]
MLSKALYLGRQKKLLLPHMCVKQKLGEIIRLSSSYFVILFALLIFSSLLTSAVLLHIPQHAMAQTDNKQTDNKESKSNFLRYENPSYGITIQYPTDWNRIKPVTFKGHHNIAIVEFKSPLQNDLATIRISVHNLTSHNMLDQFTTFFDKSDSQKILLRGFILSYFTSLLTKKLPDFVFIKSESDEKTTLADNPAQKIVYQYRDEQDIIKAMEVLTVKGDRGFIISYTAEVSKYPDFIPIIKKMMDSFEIK